MIATSFPVLPAACAVAATLGVEVEREEEEEEEEEDVPLVAEAALRARSTFLASFATLAAASFLAFRRAASAASSATP